MIFGANVWVPKRLVHSLLIARKLLASICRIIVLWKKIIWDLIHLEFKVKKSLDYIKSEIVLIIVKIILKKNDFSENNIELKKFNWIKVRKSVFENNCENVKRWKKNIISLI